MTSMPVERPAVRCGEGSQLVQRLGKGNQECRLLACCTDLQELEGQGRLARACLAFEQIEARPGQAACQDAIQAVDAGGQTWWRDRLEHVPRLC